MKKYLFIILLALVSLSGQAKKHKQLVILHTNDTHSAILPINEQLPDTMKAGRGGFLRRIAMLKEERAKHPDLLYFDSGDFFQGSAYFTMFKGDVEVGLMNQMGLDATTIGNHEFDFGLENMARVFKLANFPIVCTNYDFTGTPMEGICKPWIVLKRNGLKIGVFAVCCPSGTRNSYYVERTAEVRYGCLHLTPGVEQQSWRGRPIHDITFTQHRPGAGWTYPYLYAFIGILEEYGWQARSC